LTISTFYLFGTINIQDEIDPFVAGFSDSFSRNLSARPKNFPRCFSAKIAQGQCHTGNFLFKVNYLESSIEFVDRKLFVIE
jgi:hypothetical protein